jgi:hypothetical protein
VRIPFSVRSIPGDGELLQPTVVLLHRYVTTGEWKNHDPSRFARHYGDVGALLALPDVRDLLDDRRPGPTSTKTFVS